MRELPVFGWYSQGGVSWKGVVMAEMRDWKQWECAVHQICGDFSMAPPSQAQLFIGDIQCTDLGGLAIARIQTNASYVSRRKIRSEDGEYCFLVQQRQGTMVVNQGDTQIVLKPGDMALLDSASCFDMLPQGYIEQISVHLPRSKIEKQLIGRPCFGWISQLNLSGQVLRGLVQQLASSDMPHWVEHQDGEALQAALISLIQPTLSIDTSLLMPLRMLAEKLILQSLHDRDLSPKFLAQRLHISIRQLYRLFDDNDEGVARHITIQRLRKSIEDLSDCAKNRLSITDIAHKWGFYDSAHYSRVFKKYYEMTQREYRKNAVHMM